MQSVRRPENVICQIWVRHALPNLRGRKKSVPALFHVSAQDDWRVDLFTRAHHSPATLEAHSHCRKATNLRLVRLPCPETSKNYLYTFEEIQASISISSSQASAI